MSIRINTKDFRVRTDESVDLTDRPTRVKPDYKSKDQYQQVLAEHSKLLSERQRIHSASNHYALLLIFQAMDAAGKDGSIRHVMSGINPQGCEVFSFKQPSAEELEHDFLWRTTRCLPERGRIGIFNRSYYEDVLIVRVHPELLRSQGLPDELIDEKSIWTERYRSIVDFEEHLHRNGTRIVKIFLHISKDEQRKRFLSRIDEPDKNWKFSLADVQERKFWKEYMHAYEACLSATSTHHAPWHIIPADDKENARLIVSQIVLDAFDDIKMKYPKTTDARRLELEAIRKDSEGSAMTNKQAEPQYAIGMVGLGVMGRNFVLNIADHGYSVAGYDKSPGQVDALNREAGERAIHASGNVSDFVTQLRRPRAIIVLVPAGAPVDSVIGDLLPGLENGDLIIDAGNSYFKDTDARAAKLAAKGIQFLGVGVSGGEEGARHGPSIMPGGSKEAYERVRPMFEAAAAKVNGEPCVAYLGSGSAGHFVKMVHNGIEYGVMQLISETYDLMKNDIGLSDDEMHEVYASWNEGPLNSYLVEITSHIFLKSDEKTGKRLIDEILDVAKQKGTGMWTSQSAMELQAPTPTIDLAVAMRDLSVYEEERAQASAIYGQPARRIGGDRKALLAQLANALHVAITSTYAQGMGLLAVASDKYEYHLDLEVVSRIWRGGCIIRAALLDDICAAFHAQPALRNLLLDRNLARTIMDHQNDLRQVVCRAAESATPAPGFMVSLGYIDAYRSAWLPANLIQAQRDYFGAHTYERIDAKGAFHSEWEKD